MIKYRTKTDFPIYDKRGKVFEPNEGILKHL